METGTHSPWVSRVLTELGHEVIVAHAQKVRLIVKSRRKDDRLDARTLARLARIDPELLSPVKHRSAQAQLHLAEIRARAGLHGVHHDGAKRLVEGESGPQFLLDAEPVTRARDAARHEGGAQGEERRFDLLPLGIEPGQTLGGVGSGRAKKLGKMLVE